MSKAYVIPDGSAPPRLANDEKWDVIKTALLYLGKNNGEPIQKKSKVATFNIAGTDRESIKKEMCRLIDEVFDAFNVK